LTPEKLRDGLSEISREHASASQLDDGLKEAITWHMAQGDLVLALSAGGGGSLDEWIRAQFAQTK
ncbi:MAG: hypothetical protein ACMG55_06775, partial [Microcoleus sp.]